MQGDEQLAIIIPKLRELGARIDPSQQQPPDDATAIDRLVAFSGRTT